MKEEYPGYIPQQPEHGGTFHETESPVHYVERPPSETSGVLNNLWPTLTGNATDGYKLIMTLGHVDARKHTGDAAVPLAITNIPGQPDPILNALTVVDGDKIFCEILESTTGVATAAEIKKASSWPTSTAAALAGGSSSGSTGTRNVRLSEIETVDGLVRVKVYHSGNIAHFAPELVENTASPVSPGVGGRILKLWNAATGQWLLRMLSKGFGQATITENTDTVEIRGTQKDSTVETWRGDAVEESTFLDFRDGFEISGDEVVGDEDPPVAPAEKILYIPTVEDWDDPDAQIQVTNLAAGPPYRYEVRGNGVNGSLVTEWGSSSPLIEWKDGLVITEGEIEIPTPDAESASHPWKVTDAGSGNVAIAAGFVNGYYLTFGGFSGAFDGSIEGPDDIVKGPAFSYAGGTAAVTGTQYVYAIINRNRTSGSTPYAGNQDIENPSDPGFTGGQEIHNFDEIEPSGFTAGSPTQTATIAIDSASPDTYTPASGKAAVCIAKVTNASGTIAVDAQYVTHNPDMFIPIAKSVWGYYSP